MSNFGCQPERTGFPFRDLSLAYSRLCMKLIRTQRRESRKETAQKKKKDLHHSFKKEVRVK